MVRMVKSVYVWTAACAFSLLLLAAPAVLGADAPSPRTTLVGVVNVNTATPEQLELLPGVGPSRARAIVEHRKEHGAYAKVDDLVNVSGIGEKALEQMRAHCAVQGKTTAKVQP